MSSVSYAVCNQNFTIVDGKDVLELKRAREYIVSEFVRDGQVKVFTNYWAWVPQHLFPGTRRPL